MAPDYVEQLKGMIRSVPDWPKKGIVFRDITTLLKDPRGLALAMELLATPYKDSQIDLVVGAESRGFIFGTTVADRLSAGFVPVRKPGKLPAATRSAGYELEYGTDTLEIHVDAIEAGQRVLLVDDLLATGGTMKACCDLVRLLGGEIVGAAFLIELGFLHGRDKLAGIDVQSVICYDAE